MGTTAAAHETSSANGRIWASVDRLVDRAPLLSDLQSHRLELFAARRYRALGRPVPPEIVQEERVAAVAALAAPVLLARVRSAYDGRMLLLKGPEVAARYPDPALRQFKDLDLLVGDAEAAQRALLAAGFEPVGDPELYVEIHHLRPVWLPGFPITIEVHSRPKWIDGLDPPPCEELFSVAVPSASGVDGILALPPLHHSLVLVAHAWGHEPLRTVRDLIDVAVMAEGVDRGELRELARAWNMERVWRTTVATAEALLLDGPCPLAIRSWARNLVRARERSVFESHLQRWLSSFSALPLGKALRTTASVIVDEFRPSPGERWRTKLVRSLLAVRRALMRRSEHDRDLERRGASGRGARSR